MSVENPKKTFGESKSGYDGIFLERGGADVRNMVNELLKSPPFELSNIDKNEVYHYENNLADTKLENNISISEVFQKNDEALIKVFPQAFIDGVVSDENVDLPVFNSHDEVNVYLAKAVANKDIDAKTVKKMSELSKKYYIEKTSQALIDGMSPDESVVSNFDIVCDSNIVLENAQNLVNTRKIIHSEWEKYHETGANIESGKKAITEIYLARTNAALAAKIPELFTLANQADISGNTKLAELARSMIPRGFLSAFEKDDVAERLNRRLDYLKFGAGRNEQGKSSGVDTRVERAVINAKNEIDELYEAHFSPENVDRLKNTMIEPEQIEDIFKTILSSKGLLSSEDSGLYDPNRIGRASDELFQVIQNDKAKTFEVNGVKGVLKTPTVQRSIWDLLVVGLHEMEHVNQVQSDKELGSVIKIAALKGKRTSYLREGCANTVQRDFEYTLSGQSKGFSLAYAKGVQAVERGGSVFDAAKAFFDEKQLEDESHNDIKNANLAADRSLRLVRSGGYSSGAMSYAEEALLQDELSQATQEEKKRTREIVSFDFVDQMRLHKYGLLPEVENVSIDWRNSILAALEPCIIDALKEN